MMSQTIVKMEGISKAFAGIKALDNVQIDLRQGEIHALMGENGAGKSTMLKLICQIIQPYKGSVSVNGRISPLIELGAGFDMDMTARENIHLNGAVLGYSEEFINQHFDEIVDFAEIREFLDVPLKNFSSGMTARLGFAIATIVKPDILIVDEVLSVGDISFQKKCEERMNEMLRDGVTLLYVSHSIESVRKLCDHVIWIEHGEVQMTGDTESICDQYEENS